LEDAFDRVIGPITVESQRASALRFGDKRVQALFAVLVVFSLQLCGFNNREMRALLAQLLGLDPANYPAGSMTYDIRWHPTDTRRLHGHAAHAFVDYANTLADCSRAAARVAKPKLAWTTLPREETPSGSSGESNGPGTTHWALPAAANGPQGNKKKARSSTTAILQSERTAVQ
jgi:hypothetical protein